jgi:hypothetical protein
MNTHAEYDNRNSSRVSVPISFHKSASKNSKFKIQISNSESAPLCAMTLFYPHFPGLSDLPRFQVTVSTHNSPPFYVLMAGPIHHLCFSFGPWPSPRVPCYRYRYMSNLTPVFQKYGTNITFPQCHGYEVKWVLQKRLRRDSSICS